MVAHYIWDVGAQFKSDDFDLEEYSSMFYVITDVGTPDLQRMG